MLLQPRTHFIVEGRFEGIWDELDKASGCSKRFSKDLYGVRDPLHSKRIARGWCPENTKGLALRVRQTGYSNALDVQMGMRYLQRSCLTKIARMSVVVELLA
jgi:hypothetical protein